MAPVNGSVLALIVVSEKPSFDIVMRYINCYVLLRTFWAEVICSRQTDTWFSVSRYPQPTATN